MKVNEKYTIDKEHECKQVFRTNDPKHPGVQKVMKQGPVNLAGPVTVLSESVFPEEFKGIYQRPAEARKLFAERGWSTVAVLQLRNPMHNSHAYLAWIAIEVCDGVYVHQTLGKLKPGDIPADVIFYLLRSQRFDAPALETLLYDSSGFLGLSGVSEDMKVLQESNDPRAILAVDYFVYCLAKYVGAYTAVLGGLDALVFSGGIGEHSAPIRAALCARLEWFGVKLDSTANVRNARCVSTSDSRVSVWVIPTDEDLLIARHTFGLIPSRPATCPAEQSRIL